MLMKTLLISFVTVSAFKEENGMEVVQKWVRKMKNEPLPNFCKGPKLDFVNEDDLIIKSVPCHSKGAIKRYEFDGNFHDGKMRGKGTLKLHPDAPFQEKCIKVIEGMSTLPSPQVIQGSIHKPRGLKVAKIGLKGSK